MNQPIKNAAPNGSKKRKWAAVALNVVIAGLLSIWGIYGIGEYGLALFVFTPLLMGAGPVIVYGLKKHVTLGEALSMGLLTLGIYTAGLLVFAVEGLICIAMAAPFGCLLTGIGSFIGYAIVKKARRRAPATLLLLTGFIPGLAFLEKNSAPALTAVVTSIEINAAPPCVWKNVVEFPQLEEPDDFIFKIGIAYPIHAKIEGSGVGAVRYCNFTTGSFVEPITVWDEPRLLKFDVLEQPAPMKELSFWNVNAPHLHDYFVSKQGQFKLTALPQGRTRLEGTTWYYHHIKPAIYWKIWSDPIVHKIHNRVLQHIKTKSETERKNDS